MSRYAGNRCRETRPLQARQVEARGQGWWQPQFQYRFQVRTRIVTDSNKFSEHFLAEVHGDELRFAGRRARPADAPCANEGGVAMLSKKRDACMTTDHY